jgi:tRNA threonylcarbamoyladenosine biosynthesis protein TsaE
MDEITKTEKETFLLGKTLARQINSGSILLLQGDLGAGKSVFIRGVMRSLGVNEAIPSPTFTIVNQYEGTLPGSDKRIPLYHFDLYRINDPYELYEIGFEEYVYSDGVTFIEWPDKAGELIPEDCMVITITIVPEGRKISLTGIDRTGQGQ